MAKLAAVAEQSWLGVVVVAVPFETIAACDTCVIQNSHALSLLITKKGMPSRGTRTRQAPSW
jgi:hypothetical protein